MMKLSTFLKSKGMIYAVVLAVFYQAAMVGLYIYGYHVLPGGVDKLSVNIVNQDGSQGQIVQSQLAANLPFKHIVTDMTLEESQKLLDRRAVQMVIVIPENFVVNLAKGKSEFEFYINQSNTITTSSTMTSVAQAVTNNFNDAVREKKVAGVLENLHLDAAEQQAVTAQLHNAVVQKNVYSNQAPQSMDYIMAPTFLSIGTYASSMVVAIILMNIFLAFIPIMGKRKAFYYIETAGCVIALLAPAVGVIVARCLISISFNSLLRLYLQQVFMQLTAFQFTLVFSLLFGQNGIFVNIFFMLTQTIAGGGTMALEVMPSLFRAVSYITPMYPNTQINFGLMYGGPVRIYELRMGIILVVSSVLLLLIIRFKYRPESENAQPAAGATA
jgi:hypothetical protein